VFEGITAAGTVPDSHRIPLHRGGPKPPDYHLLRRKGTTFFPNHQPIRKNIPKQKRKGTEIH